MFLKRQTPMRPRLAIYLFSFVFFTGAAAQQPYPTSHTTQISDTARISATLPYSVALAPLIYLASDRLEGRHIGSPWIDTAANYIVAQFRKAGAHPAPGAKSYFQVFTKSISRRDLQRVGQDLQYNMPGQELRKDYKLRNIIACIPGTDPVLRKQYIMLSAHYDHIGRADYPLEVDGKPDSIYNGARDNATGTAAVIAAARYFGNYPPRRSVLLACFTAEEEGEFGSEYYSDNPLVPLEQTVFDLNIDNAAYNTTNAICLFGLGRTSPDSLITKACLTYSLAVLAEPPSLNLFERSDNFNFARYGMPAPCFSMGMKKWDAEIDRTYHRRDDNVDNMDLDYVVKFIRAYILSAQYIANDPVQPHWTTKDEFQKGWLKLYAPAHH
jgi:Zn-dependent M28 family amino/carboxypeptidase